MNEKVGSEYLIRSESLRDYGAPTDDNAASRSAPPFSLN